MQSEPTVFILDDDPTTRASLRRLIESAGLRAETHETAQEFLDTDNVGKPGCVLVYVRMPGINGMELQRKLAARTSGLPVIIITGCGDVSTAVQAMKDGAFDFIEKPFADAVLLDRIRQAIDLDARNHRNHTQYTDIVASLARLTPREREVMDLVVAGYSNKQIAAILGISQKTVEIHRANVMRKTEAGSVAALVRMARFAHPSA